MLEIYPKISFNKKCPSCNDNDLVHESILWQGVHICTNSFCPNCREKYIIDLPVAQGQITPLYLKISDSKIYNFDNQPISKPYWYSTTLSSILERPEYRRNIKLKRVKLGIPKSRVIVLNTLNYVYGHSLLQLFNLSRIIEKCPKDTGIIVIIQPFLRWLIPEDKIQEIWEVQMPLHMGKFYFPILNEAINKLLSEFEIVYLSSGHILPYPVNIHLFTKVHPFSEKVVRPRITYIWREDYSRLWINSWLIHKVMVRLKLGLLLLPLQYCRVLILLSLLKHSFPQYEITIAGLGNSFRFPNYIDDKRVVSFSHHNEQVSTRVYAESKLVIGIHGSSMILPSAHAEMVISLMPPRRWGNYLEDILPHSKDLRTTIFDNRIIPVNISLFELLNVCTTMVLGRNYFKKKFNNKNDNL